MSEVKKWYIGAYSGDAQARPCHPAEFEIIHASEGRYFVLAEDFDRVTAERDAALRQVETITADRDAEKQMKAKARIQRDVQAAKATDLQERLTAADERADVLEVTLRKIKARLDAYAEAGMRMPESSVEVCQMFAEAALKPAEGDSYE